METELFDLLLLKVQFKVLNFKGTTFKVQYDAQKPSRGCSCIISGHIFNNNGESHSEIIGFGFRVCCGVTLESNTGKHLHIIHYISQSVDSRTTEKALVSHM